VNLRLLRTHSYLAAGLFGLVGGVVAWSVGEPVWYYGRKLLAKWPFLHAVFGESPDVLFAATLGLYLGFFLGGVEGILACQMRVLAQGLIVGGAAGMVGGFLGSFLGEVAFRLLGGSQAGRALGWAVFGAFLGVSPGLALRTVDRAARGFLGGSIGGFVGGMLFFLVSALFKNPLLGRAASIPLLGAALGMCYGLSQTLMRKMWITVLSGRNEGYQYPIGARPVTLGSSNRADVCLIGDPPLPGLAAKLVPSEKGVVLERLDVDRVEINREPSEGKILRDGDVIRIRGVRVLFSVRDAKGGGQERSPRPETKPTGSPSSEAEQRVGSSPNGKPKSSRGACSFVGLSEPVLGRKYPLTKDQIRIGRDDDNDVVVDHLSVSLHHAEIARKGRFWVLFDLGSSNGTFVQGRRIRENALKRGFVVEIGQVKFRFEEE